MPRSHLRFYHRSDFGTRLGMGLWAVIGIIFVLIIVKLLLPWLLLLSGIGVGYYIWKRYRQFQRRLYTCFYDCIEVNQGRISALDFAMTAHITGPQARSFLDARAKDFFADFEPTAHGDVLYTFRRNSPTTAPSSSSEAPTPLQLPDQSTADSH